MSWPLYRSPSCARNENQLGRLQGFSHRDCDAVGVGPVRLTVAIKAEWRNDRNNALVQQRLKKFGVDPFNLPGKQVVDAMDDSQRMRNDGVCARGAEVVGRKAFQDLVRETVRGVNGQLQCRGIGHAGAIQVGGLDILLFGESLNLLGRAVHQHHADVQGTQHGDVQEDVGEVLVRDDDSIHCNNECLFAELRDVLKNPAQVC